MKQTQFFFDYFAWHYGRGFKDLIRVWSNFLWFLFQFFSIQHLLRTLFSPFKRVSEEYKRSSIEDLAGSFVVNTITRILGASVRLMIILCGLLVLLAWCLLLAVLIAFWLFTPVVLLVMLAYGLTLLVI